VGFRHIFCTNIIVECCAVSLKTREITSVFPLYLYPSAEEVEIGAAAGDRRANLAPEFVESFLAAVGVDRLENSPTVGERSRARDVIYPEDIFYYIYAVLHSPTYRERYAEFLKIDFPRIPLPKDYGSFDKLAAAGAELVNFHLLKSKESWDWGGIGQVGSAKDTMVGKVEYDEKSREIIFDAKRKPEEQVRVGPVPPEIWEFHVGGYQVLAKWLNDRKGRPVDLGEYVPIIVALTETDRIMRVEIDPVFCEMMGIS
jgi:predicted helicase